MAESAPLIDHESQTHQKPQTDSKPQRSIVESFWAANAWKLIVLLALFLTGCLGLGVKHWLENKETAIDLTQIRSSFEVRTHAADQQSYKSVQSRHLFILSFGRHECVD